MNTLSHVWRIRDYVSRVICAHKFGDIRDHVSESILYHVSGGILDHVSRVIHYHMSGKYVIPFQGVIRYHTLEGIRDHVPGKYVITFMRNKFTIFNLLVWCPSVQVGELFGPLLTRFAGHRNIMSPPVP